MDNNIYDKGRLNLPFVGICTFGKYKYIEDWDKIKSIYWRVYSPATRPRSTYVIGWDKKNKFFS